MASEKCYCYPKLSKTYRIFFFLEPAARGMHFLILKKLNMKRNSKKLFFLCPSLKPICLFWGPKKVVKFFFYFYNFFMAVDLWCKIMVFAKFKKLFKILFSTKYLERCIFKLKIKFRKSSSLAAHKRQSFHFPKS